MPSKFITASALLASTMLATDPCNPDRTLMSDIPSDDERKRKDAENKLKQDKNNLQEFDFYGQKVYASNYKNALRKAKKLNLLY